MKGMSIRNDGAVRQLDVDGIVGRDGLKDCGNHLDERLGVTTLIVRGERRNNTDFQRILQFNGDGATSLVCNLCSAL